MRASISSACSGLQTSEKGHNPLERSTIFRLQTLALYYICQRWPVGRKVLFNTVHHIQKAGWIILNVKCAPKADLERVHKLFKFSVNSHKDS